MFNESGGILLVNLESFESRYYAIPGGGVDADETLEEAVYREIYEELGINRDLLELVGKSKKPLRFKFKEIKLNRGGLSYEGSERHFFGFVFTGSHTDIAPRKGEVRTYRWASIDELKDYLLFDNQLEETMGKVFEIFPPELIDLYSTFGNR